MPLVIHASDAAWVTSASSLEVETDDPSVRLMIFSGVAAPNLTVDDTDFEDLVRDEVTVKLGVSVSALKGAVVQVGLASISNDESTFVFAVESATVEVDPATSELQLRVQAAVLGDDTALHRFSYQVVAHVTKVASQIAGTIRVPRQILDLSNKTRSEVDASFRVTANRIEIVPPAPDAMPPFSSERVIPVVTGKLGPVTTVGEDGFVSYVIDGCPFNTPLRVLVEVSGNLQGLSALQVAGQRPVLLTTIMPAVSGVDFAVVKLPVA